MVLRVVEQRLARCLRLERRQISLAAQPHPPTTLLIDKRATLVQDASVFSAVGSDET
jgi:hypothetical protein